MSTNPLPIADFVDAVVVGEVEPVADSLIACVEDAGLRGLAKDQLLRGLASLPGLYVPAMGQTPVRRVWSSTQAIAPEPQPRPGSHFGDMFLVEVGRGCGRGCHFCAAGNLYRPVRMRSRKAILAVAGDAAKVGLVGTAVGDHPDLVDLLRELTMTGRTVGIGSLRPDQINPEIAGLLVEGGVKTVAIAPEAGTERLRAGIGKSFSDAAIFDAVGALSAAGLRNVKLYFMIGLPGEEDGDVEAAVELVENQAGIRGRTRLTVAVSPFVPKPHTVLQWAPFCDKRVLRRRAGILRRVARIRGCSIKVQPIDEAWVEAVFSRGDRSLSGPILEAARGRTSLKRALRQSPIKDPTVELDTEKPLPWDFIDSGVDKKGLKRKYLKLQARLRVPSPPHLT